MLGFFFRSKSKEMTYLQLNSDYFKIFYRKYAAIILNSEKGQIYVFEMQTLKKKRVLNLPHESTTNRFECISFTHDDLFIVAITGEPDWNMIVYNWTKGKVLNITKAVHPGSSGTVVQVRDIKADNN